MPSTPFITIVVPFKNSEATVSLLAEAITEANCDPKNVEMIAVNDGSYDRGEKILRDAGFTVIDNAPSSGPAAARNKGAHVAKGKILLFLDADVIPRPDLVARVEKRFREDEKLTALSGIYDTQPANEGFFPRYKALRCRDWFTGVRRFGSLETACAAIRRDAFIKAGGFDESYTGADVEDYEFGYRLAGAEGIAVDHEMVVRHHFPNFMKNLENYARRSYQWAKLKRPRAFDTAATTPTEAVAALSGVTSIPLFFLALILGNAWLNIASFALQGLQVFLRRRFYTLCHNEEGPRFTVLAVAATIAGDCVVIPAAIWGHVTSIFESHSKV